MTKVGAFVEPHIHSDYDADDSTSGDTSTIFTVGSENSDAHDAEGEPVNIADDTSTASNFTPHTDDTIILLLGQTGSGKTTFVRHATGDKKIIIKEALESQTKDITEYRLTISNRRVILVDTPGSEDTRVPSADTFKQLADWLKKSYNEGKRIAGIIYFSRIVDDRVLEFARRNIEVFKELCGDSFMKNVTLLSTLWSDEGWKFEHELEKEQQYMETEKYWGSMIKQGAKTGRHRSYGPHQSKEARASAHEIISKTLSNQPRKTRIQEEMVEEGKELGATGASKKLVKTIDKIVENNNGSIRNIEAEISRSDSTADQERNRVELERLSNENKTLYIQKQILLGVIGVAGAAAGAIANEVTTIGGAATVGGAVFGGMAIARKIGFI